MKNMTFSLLKICFSLWVVLNYTVGILAGTVIIIIIIILILFLFLYDCDGNHVVPVFYLMYTVMYFHICISMLMCLYMFAYALYIYILFILPVGRCT